MSLINNDFSHFNYHKIYIIIKSRFNLENCHNSLLRLVNLLYLILSRYRVVSSGITIQNENSFRF